MVENILATENQNCSDTATEEIPQPNHGNKISKKNIGKKTKFNSLKNESEGI